MIAGVAAGAAVGITGLGTCLPDRAVTNAEVGAPLGVDDEWIHSRSGIRERRIAGPGQAASDLAVPAARRALEAAAADPASVDLVIVATATPDVPVPATAALVASSLGATGAAAYDLSAPSTGFVYGLAQAHAAVAAGLASRVLVIAAEVLSRLVDWSDRSTAILFADGAGAVLVERVHSGGFLGFELGADGSGFADLLVPAGGSRLPASEDTVRQDLHLIRMNGASIFRFSTRVAPASARRLLDRCGLGIEDVDLYVPHQSNRRIVEHTARSLGLPPERVVLELERVGNTASASIPLALEAAIRDRRLRAGTTALLSAVGAGLTWGTALLRWTGPVAA